MTNTTGTTRKRKSTSEKRQDGTTALILGQLKFPLVFFGLALVLVESAFVVVLQRPMLAETAVLEIVRYMAGLFALSTATVGLLVWKVPQHIMLTAQTDPPIDLLKQVRRTVRAFEALREWEQLAPEAKSPSALLGTFQRTLQLIQGENVAAEEERAG
jgi:hypothetical protein